jgi:hypothetical protein
MESFEQQLRLKVIFLKLFYVIKQDNDIYITKIEPSPLALLHSGARKKVTLRHIFGIDVITQGKHFL